ncbi:cupredoxin domain-containing protein [Phormidium sp. FACHB-592]|uniref:Cupredoxin domain-containing protein n=1 Tax=Stenomitos frigidus AS-A4 TaxID=2933935 RepID=A0ABV0KJ91_9CYAN|nr:cupredoxin domain-containing protein [Phormidium sp. FACHB-592]MBD2073745.1 cupredoxin domain-containing protein [Phormidium sp. FACHB-592]
MFNRKTLVAELAGLGLFLGLASSVALLSSSDYANAQMAMAMPDHQTTQFHRLEQPLGLKIGVVVGGAALIGLELWWFLFSKKQSHKAEATQGVQELTIIVDGGYEPSRIVASVGQPVRLNFFRKDPSSCLETVLVPAFHIARKLNLNQVTAVEFTPDKPGHYPFTCGMNMFQGVVEVEAAAPKPMRQLTALQGDLN